MGDVARRARLRPAGCEADGLPVFGSPKVTGPKRDGYCCFGRDVASYIFRFPTPNWLLFLVNRLGDRTIAYSDSLSRSGDRVADATLAGATDLSALYIARVQVHSQHKTLKMLQSHHVSSQQQPSMRALSCPSTCNGLLPTSRCENHSGSSRMRHIVISQTQSDGQIVSLERDQPDRSDSHEINDDSVLISTPFCAVRTTESAPIHGTAGILLEELFIGRSWIFCATTCGICFEGIEIERPSGRIPPL